MLSKSIQLILLLHMWILFHFNKILNEIWYDLKTTSTFLLTIFSNLDKHLASFCDTCTLKQVCTISILDSFSDCVNTASYHYKTFRQPQVDPHTYKQMNEGLDPFAPYMLYLFSIPYSLFGNLAIPSIWLRIPIKHSHCDCHVQFHSLTGCHCSFTMSVHGCAALIYSSYFDSEG